VTSVLQLHNLENANRLVNYSFVLFSQS